MIWVITEIEDGFSFCVEYSSGHIFYGNCGLHHRGQESVHEGGSHQQGSGEGRVLFLLGLFWAGGIGKQDVVKGGIAFPFDEEVCVFV